MARPTPYFDLLEDELLEEVITRIPVGEYRQRGWVALSASSRKLCTLVRRLRKVEISITERLCELRRMLRIPPNRAFHHIRQLGVHEAHTSSLQEWGQFTAALAAAATAWSHLEQVHLDVGLYRGPSTNDYCAPGCLSSPLLALSQAPALRRLRLSLYDDASLVYVPALTQLTQLDVFWYGDARFVTVGHGPLADMRNLRSLRMVAANVEAGAPCALPPNLTKLHLAAEPGCEGDWVVHLAGCQQLQELRLQLHWGEIAVHPTLLIHLIAQQLTGLVKLEIFLDKNMGQDVDQPEVLADVLAETAGEGEEEEEAEADDFSQLPLVINGSTTAPTVYTMVPPHNIGALSSLQQVGVSGWWLVVTSERHWRALGSCSRLEALKGLHASVAPPAGVVMPKLQELWVTSSTSPGDTLALLGAFPALQTLHLTVVPSGPVPDQLPAARPVMVQKLSAACIGFQWPPVLASAAAAEQAPYVSAYCSSLWAALPGLRVLALQWPSRGPWLPYSSGLREEDYIRVDAARALGAIQGGEGAPVYVEAGQLLPVVSGARQLQVLDLRMELDPSSRDQLVMGVQEALPGLTRLGTLDGAAGLAPATLAVVRPGLLHDLTAPNWRDDPFCTL